MTNGDLSLFGHFLRLILNLSLFGHFSEKMAKKLSYFVTFRKISYDCQFCLLAFFYLSSLNKLHCRLFRSARRHKDFKT